MIPTLETDAVSCQSIGAASGRGRWQVARRTVWSDVAAVVTGGLQAIGHGSRQRWRDPGSRWFWSIGRFAANRSRDGGSRVGSSEGKQRGSGFVDIGRSLGHARASRSPVRLRFDPDSPTSVGVNTRLEIRGPLRGSRDRSHLVERAAAGAVRRPGSERPDRVAAAGGCHPRVGRCSIRHFLGATDPVVLLSDPAGSEGSGRSASRRHGCGKTAVSRQLRVPAAATRNGLRRRRFRRD